MIVLTYGRHHSWLSPLMIVYMDGCFMDDCHLTDWRGLTRLLLSLCPTLALVLQDSGSGCLALLIAAESFNAVLLFYTLWGSTGANKVRIWKYHLLPRLGARDATASKNMLNMDSYSYSFVEKLSWKREIVGEAWSWLIWPSGNNAGAVPSTPLQ